MNERIKELADQAGFTEGGYELDDGPWIPAEFNIEKFAELIVQSCVKLIRNKDYSHTADPIFEASCDMQEHFGVVK